MSDGKSILTPELVTSVLLFIRLAMQEVPTLIEAGQRIIKLLTSGQDPTPEEQAEIDAMLQASHEALQAKLVAVINVADS